MASTKTNCAGCLKAIDTKLFLKCSLCKKKFDLRCANLSETRFQNSMTAQQKNAWKCMHCIIKEPKTGVSTTPGRSDIEGVSSRRGGATRMPQESPIEESVSPYSSALDSTDDVTIDHPSDIKILINEVRQFREEMSATRRQIIEFNATISKLSDRLDNCDNRIDQLGTRIGVLEQRMDNSVDIEQVDKTIQESIQHLQSELNDRDQELLLNDVEISCIPEDKAENLTHIVMTLASKVGMALTDEDIVSVARVGPSSFRPQSHGSSQLSQSPRPRIIVARLARRAVRDKLLQSARVRRGATTEDTGLPGPPCRFYINERLTKTNRALFRRAREIGQRLHWRFIWTKEGKIFVRQHSGDNTPRHRLRSEKDLARVFGSNNICAQA